MNEEHLESSALGDDVVPLLTSQFRKPSFQKLMNVLPVWSMSDDHDAVTSEPSIRLNKRIAKEMALKEETESDTVIVQADFFLF